MTEYTQSILDNHYELISRIAKVLHVRHLRTDLPSGTELHAQYRCGPGFGEVKRCQIVIQGEPVDAELADSILHGRLPGLPMPGHDQTMSIAEALHPIIMHLCGSSGRPKSGEGRGRILLSLNEPRLIEHQHFDDLRPAASTDDS